VSVSQSGFLVIKDSSTVGGDALSLVKIPASQESLVEVVSSFNLPMGMFRESDPTAVVKVEAQLATGQPLPSWITFDPDNGRFTAKPPVGTGGVLDIKIIARDQNGNVAEAQFLYYIVESKSSKPAGLDAAKPARHTDSGEQNSDSDDTTVHKPHNNGRNNPSGQHSGVHDLTSPLRHAAAPLPAGRASLAEQIHRSRMPQFLGHQKLTSPQPTRNV